MNDDPEENTMDDERKEENIMDAESGEIYPTLSGNWPTWGVPLWIIPDEGSPITGQPVISALIDSASRYVLGVHVEGRDTEQEQVKE